MRPRPCSTRAWTSSRESDSVEPDKLAEQEGVYAIGYNAVSADVPPTPC